MGEGNAAGSREAARQRMLAYLATRDVEADDRLPGEDKLCDILGASRVTVRAVLEELFAEGKLLRQPGQRCHINPEYRRIRALLYPYEPLEKSIIALGYTPGSRNLRTKRIEAGEKLAAALKIDPGDEVVQSTYLFYADDVFCVLCRDYIPAEILSKDDIVRLDIETSILFRLLFEKTGRKTAWDMMELTATDSRKAPEMARYGGLKEGEFKAYLQSATTVYDVHNRPIFHSLLQYDPDIFTFDIVRRRRYDFEDFWSEELG